MKRVLFRAAAILLASSPFIATSWVAAQQNGEAHATVPTVVKTDYDMRRFIAPLPLTAAQLNGRGLVAQRCANCHGGTPRNPGPLLGKQTVERLGDAAIREKVMKGSQAMPGFARSLEPAQIDDIISFLKTFEPRAQPTSPE
jgi:mono/diheme cytochrome c family protein